MKDLVAAHYIPIYDFTVKIIVCDDISKTYRGMNKWFGAEYDDDQTVFQGLFAWCNRKGGLFLTRKHLSHSLIAHEIRHAVDRIMGQCDVQFGPNKCMETSAILQEYLAGIVYKQLKKWKVRIK